MKKRNFLVSGMMVLGFITTNQVMAQEEEPTSKFNVNADLYSNYIWRGSKLGTGPSLQPSVTFKTGGLAVGVWGSFDANGYMEADPYFSYSFPFGLSLGITDYYLPGRPLFEVSDTAGNHALELNGGFTKWGLALSANYIVNEAGGVASIGGDMYFQAGYAFRYFNIFLGAGNGWHTSDGDFAICNIGIGTTKEIKITDTFTIPVTGQVIVNPERERLFVVVGFSF
jgi:hypothetical protein